jgi:PadR family transcriptional regulator PadR
MNAPQRLDKWTEQLRRGGLELAILLSVSSTSRYGLEIIRYLQDSTDLVVSEGTIYPILARLTRQGVVEAEWVSDETPHPRKYYRLSSRGRRALEDMLDHWASFRRSLDRLIEAAGRQ